jgi:capsular exopolysaccharide synthesis family protein
MLKEDVVELRWCFSVIRRWLWLIVGCVLLGATSAFLVTSWMPPVYSASATLLVHVATGTSDYTAIVTSERLALTYTQMLRGRPVMETVTARLDLEETPDALAKRVKVKPIKDTQLIRLSVEHTDPTRAALIANAIAEVFIAQIQALGRQGLTLRTDVVVIETAQVPERPVRRRTLYTALAAVVGAMLAVGAAFLLEHLDDTIKTPEDVNRALGLNTLGTIGRLAKREEELVVAAQPFSPIAEAFRVLRTNVRFSSLDRPLQTLLVTSPSLAEGKSNTTANLAVAMAQAGLRVVVVDADLRRPRLHQLFDLDLHEEGTVESSLGGLTGSLLEGCPDGRLQPTQVENLKVLPSGELPPNPAELVGSQHMQKLLHELAQQVDVGLVDSPPVRPVADATALAQAVDGVLLVLEAGKTRRQAARHAVESLHQVGASLVGVVLNAVPTHKSSYYYYETYGDGRGRRKHRRQLFGRKADRHS